MLFKKNAPIHIANSEAPCGWVNVNPQGESDPIYAGRLRTAANLIKWSTLISKINDGISESALDVNIKANRTALWLKDDKKLALVFHTLDGQTTPDASRSPKFMVDAGLDPTLVPCVQYPLECGNEVYESLRCAVAYFAKNNQPRARLYLWVEGENEPEPGDYIFPIFQYAITNDTASDEGESTAGISETYTQSDAPDPNNPRWCKSLTTWKLRRCPPSNGAGHSPAPLLVDTAQSHETATPSTG
jgi:hypothetical protein